MKGRWRDLPRFCSAVSLHKVFTAGGLRAILEPSWDTLASPAPGVFSVAFPGKAALFFTFRITITKYLRSSNAKEERIIWFHTFREHSLS